MKNGRFGNLWFDIPKNCPARKKSSLNLNSVSKRAFFKNRTVSNNTLEQKVTVLEEDKEAPCIEENNDATSGVDFWRKRWSNLVLPVITNRQFLCVINS